MDKVYKDIENEVDRQLQLWGIQDHTISRWSSILTEEVGEVAKEINELVFLGKNRSISLLRKELIQVSAVCTTLIKLIDNGSYNEHVY